MSTNCVQSHSEVLGAFSFVGDWEKALPVLQRGQWGPEEW